MTQYELKRTFLLTNELPCFRHPMGYPHHPLARSGRLIWSRRSPGSPRAIFERGSKSEHANPSPDPRAVIAREGGGPATCARARAQLLYLVS